MTDLLDHDNITIPDEYYEMKNRLIKFPTYRNPERIKAKLALIEEVYEKFFELLPEEELLTLDILENILSFTSWEESPKVEEIYEDLFEQVKRKRKFSTNDLLVIDYYFFHLYGRKQYDKKTGTWVNHPESGRQARPFSGGNAGIWLRKHTFPGNKRQR